MKKSEKKLKIFPLARSNQNNHLNERGQTTIFIIVGILIVVFGILIFMFYPNIKSSLGVRPENPSLYIQTCLEDDIEDSVEILSSQGGSIEPEHYILYKDEKIEYLCYTNEYYKTCVVQQPMLKEHIKSEIKNNVNIKARQCFEDMKASYQGRGYRFETGDADFEVELLPKRVVVRFNNSVTLEKEDAAIYEPLEVVFNNNLYELVSIANSILDWETNYGDAETTVYMNYYHDLKVEKKKQGDGTTIYILTDRNNGNKFQFASRSVAWPPGYGGGVV
ncbi:hypothetical protein CMI44_01640 [Candidatus Pacearchaeota archaeon]|nr:hypothetical protein [Candidatus Pacearchaeota archaeon]|tara:strand:+ start:109 stop:939 length:831 start_codon:yes stop_codon:yes gene_type:complete